MYSLIALGDTEDKEIIYDDVDLYYWYLIYPDKIQKLNDNP